MSSKTVKITNGKIINYTISADGYKTINGSKLITNDDSININMIAETDPNGVYSLGDRIGGIASFAGYFNGINPDTNINQTYAIFVLDAKYRGHTNWVSSSYADPYITGLPRYDTEVKAQAATDPATWTNDFLLQNASTAGGTIYAINFARNYKITINGQIYSSQLPNANELSTIFDNRVALDTFDPTVSDYPNNSLTTWSNYSGYFNYSARTCTIGNQYGAWMLGTSGSGGTRNKTWSLSGHRPSDASWAYDLQIIPVFEIPVN